MKNCFFGGVSDFVCRQCLCCFKEYKHLEVFNQLVYALINLVISQISSLRDRLCSVQDRVHAREGPGPEWSSGVQAAIRPSSCGEDEPVNVERDSAEEDADTPDLTQTVSQNQVQPKPSPPVDCQVDEIVSGGSIGCEGDGGGCSTEGQDLFSSWSTEEREKLLLCAAKIFQIQFPLYTAYKHNTHPTIEVRHSKLQHTTQHQE